MATSPSQLPRSVSPNSDEEEVNLYLKIIETVAIKARRDSTMKHIKALIQDKEQIDKNRQLLFFRGDHLEDGKRLVDYGIHGDSTLHLILQDSTRIMVNVEISSTQKNSLVEARKWDTVKDVKLMIQAKEGIPLDNFDLVFGESCLQRTGPSPRLTCCKSPHFIWFSIPKMMCQLLLKCPVAESH
ncbi:polyubiquitin [Eucalyptus grandis]|uniref:polyubiquitin n=1 Tax=Eucalyptus grandis TaxID=71139 RepID=UPI00192EC997|nr:polyubiquitin [Eucalyptus grandis]